MEEREILEDQLRTVDQAIFYLLLIILSVLLSFWSVLIQREQLDETLAGRPQNAAGTPDTFPIRLVASGLTVGALGFFFYLALQTCRSAAQGNDPSAQRSAEMNVWASFLVLAAALIRFRALIFTEGGRRSTVAENVQPE